MPHAVAQRYAHALVDAVFAPGSGIEPQVASAQLHAFGNMVQSTSELRSVLLSPAVSNSRKRGVVARLGDLLPLHHLVRNFLYVLIDRRRSDLLGDIADAFDSAVDERLGVLRADVKSAAPLSDRQREDLESALAQVAGKRIRAQFTVDQSLIGGVVARIGSTVYDGSVRTQLQSMQQLLMS